MDLEEFESEARTYVEQTLNQLHTAALLAGRLETEITEAGETVQTLSQLIEHFIAQQKRQSSSS
jgi:hypothetical protein